MRHPALAELPTASLDRAIGRNLDLWLSDAPQTRKLRRLQVEAQMLWHEHDLNEAREAARQLTVNSFWLSGCGRAQSASAEVTVDDRLRAPLLAEDWAGWADSWRSLDADALGPLVAAADRGEEVSLTLCGERGWQHYDAMQRSLWQRLGDRFRTVDPHATLTAL